MQPNELLKVLKNLSKSKPIKGENYDLLKNLHGEFQPCNLTIKSKAGSTSEQVRQQIEKFAPEQGWLCFQSEVQYFPKPEDNTENAEHQISSLKKSRWWTRILPKFSGTSFKMPSSSILLYGEVLKGQKHTLHIREDGQGGWVLTEFIEGKGNNYLVEDQKFLGEKEVAPKELCYRVYWQYDDKHGCYRQAFARFNGFNPH